MESLLASLLLNNSYSIVIKPPANLSAMKPLHDIYLKYKSELPTELSDMIYWVDNVSIHSLLKNCSAVFTVNSGVGLELLHNKPVFTFSNADYHSASSKIVFGGNLKNAANAIS